jgi:biopolymer transport protein ExbD
MGMTTPGTGRSQRPVPVVNVTPLVDVALVVLIIFMVVTPLMTKVFWVNLPKQEQKEPEQKPNEKSEPLVFTIDKDGVYRVNKTVVTKQELAERLPRMLAAKGQKVLYFDAHDELEYGKAVAALYLSRQGGARSIAILTQSIVR